jgi:hypothetical protein
VLLSALASPPLFGSVLFGSVLFGSVLWLSALLLSDDDVLLVLDEGRLSVMYQPDPLKMIPAGESTRRTVWPVVGQVVSAAS